MRIDILSLFPEMFAPLQASMISRAQKAGLVQLNCTNIRDFALDKHATTDDRLYGGGAGMVMKAEPIVLAVEAAIAEANTAKPARVIFTSPAGRPYSQQLAEELSQEEQLIIVCGHYEGIDQRAIDLLATDVVSLGDFVLTGGEIPALAIADSVVRLLPGALGDERSAEEESFSEGLLEHPQYTRPPLFRDLQVPAVLQQGNHAEIEQWRRKKSLEVTLRNRPDLLANAPLTVQDAAYIGQLREAAEQPFSISAALVHYPVYNKKQQIVTTSLANLDLHDISRAACTFGLSGYYIVQPLPGQKQLIGQLMQHWQSGFGASYNPDRQQALAKTQITDTLEEAVANMAAQSGEQPKVIVTGANISSDITSFAAMREIMHKEGGSYLLVFGTGWGLAEQVIAAADYRLQPIYGTGSYNHLSVRSAASIVFDRLLGER